MLGSITENDFEKLLTQRCLFQRNVSKKLNEIILAFERDKLGVSCSRVSTNKKSGLYRLTGDSRKTWFFFLTS